MPKRHPFSPLGLLSVERVQFIWGRKCTDHDSPLTSVYPWSDKSMEVESLKKHNPYGIPPKINLRTIAQQIDVEVHHIQGDACSLANQGLPFFALNFLIEQSWRCLPLDEMIQWQRRKHCIITHQFNNLLNGELVNYKSRQITPLSQPKSPDSNRVEWEDFLRPKDDQTVPKLQLWSLI